MEKMKQLSVCMIVKDEQDLLPRCLDSVQGIADEIIIVDTGSQDATKEIAQRYTNKLYDYQWDQDFAAARNESLRHATGKWILVLDADEYLAADDHGEWLDFLATEQPAPNVAYTVPVINFTGEKDYEDEITTSPVTRLFPNFKDIQFERPIHEQLTRGMAGELYHKKIDLKIYHTGYQVSRVVKKDKHERNMLIFDRMKKNGNLSTYDWYTMGNQYRYAKEEEQAIDCYERALKGNNENTAWYPHCVIGLISLYYKHDRLNHSWQLTEEALVRYAEYPEYHFIKGVHLETLGFLVEAMHSYKKAIDVGEKRAENNQEFWLTEPGYAFESPALQLVSLNYRLKNNKEAIYWLSKLLKKNNKNPKVLLQLLEWLGQNENDDSIIAFLNQIYNPQTPQDATFLFKVSLALGYEKLVSHYNEYFYNLNDLSKAEKLRLAIVKNDRVAWKREASSWNPQRNEDIENEWLQVTLGALIWEDKQILNADANGLLEQYVVFNKLLIGSFEDKVTLSEEQLNEYADYLFQIAKHLFLMRKLDTFDRFVKAFQSPILTNRLANYFNDLNLMELAINYYSILLSKNQLNAESLENLGQYHANEGLQAETVEFLDIALKLEPKKRHLYVPLIRSANSGEKEAYISRFYEQFLNYTSISFVASFLEKQKD